MNGDRKALQEIMRQQAPRPQQIDIATFRALKCECGSIKMEAESFVILKINPLAANERVDLNVVQYRCRECRKYPVFQEGEWKFQTEAPEIPVE